MLFTVLALFAVTSAAAQDQEDAEAPPPYLNRIIFSGNTGVATSVLRDRMRTREPSFFAILRRPRLDRRQLDRDVRAIEAYYHSIGYPEARVTLDRIEPVGEGGRFADIHIKVEEGEPVRVGAVSFGGNPLLEEKKLREGLLLEPGSPYNPSLLTTDLFALERKYLDVGYFGVAIDDSVAVDGRQADILFTIDPGHQLKVGAVTIEVVGRRGETVSDPKVRQRVIESEVAFETGDVARYTKLVETQRNLFETGLFTQVDVVPINLNPEARTVDVHIKVRERRASWIEVGFGVGNVLGSRVFGEWGTRNLIGLGRTLRLRAQYAFDLFEGEGIDFDRLQLATTFYRYDIVYQQRRVLGIKLNFGTNAFVENDRTIPDIEVKTQGFSFGVSHDFSRFTEVTGSFSVENIRRRQLNLPDVDSRSHILGSSVSRDTRDFILNPRLGEYRYLSADVAGGILGGKNDFYTTTVNYQRYHWLGRRDPEADRSATKPTLTFAWRVRAGYADSYGVSPEVPLENRFFLGGANSVRGYDESSLGPRVVEDGVTRVLGGEFMLLGNLELRFPLPLMAKWHFGGAAFLDAGNVWLSASDVRGDHFELISDEAGTTDGDFRYGTGIGLRYLTPIGPIRVDYGLPLKPMDWRGTLYFSLGQIF